VQNYSLLVVVVQVELAQILVMKLEEVAPVDLSRQRH
jgi:hypothetical protein